MIAEGLPPSACAGADGAAGEAAGWREAPVVSGGLVLHWDPPTGAAVLYVRDFWDPVSGLARLRSEVEGAYIPRDDPLVTPADRKGERRPVPRDQAYFAACYTSAGDANWWASYRYNPDHTQQPAPGSPPSIIRQLSARVAALTGQVRRKARSAASKERNSIPRPPAPPPPPTSSQGNSGPIFLPGTNPCHP